MKGCGCLTTTRKEFVVLLTASTSFDNTLSSKERKLSQQRADTVREFLVQQGLPAETVTSVGLGKLEPVADNSRNQGRQKNRRVEIIVSGAVIGAKSSARAT